MSATDLIIKTASPEMLDDTVQALPGCLAAVVEGSFDGETVRVRVFGGLNFLKFALTNQGYGEVVGEESVE